MIHMEWIVVSGKTGEENDVCFGDGPAGAFPLVADIKVVERLIGALLDKLA